MEKIEALEKVGKTLLLGEQEAAKMLINEQLVGQATGEK